MDRLRLMMDKGLTCSTYSSGRDTRTASHDYSRLEEYSDITRVERLIESDPSSMLLELIRRKVETSLDPSPMEEGF